MGERVLCKHEVVGSIPSGSTKGPGGIVLSGSLKRSAVRFVREPRGYRNTRRFGNEPLRVFEIVKREWIRCGRYLNLPSSSGPRRAVEPDPFGKQKRPLARAEGRSF